LTSAYGKNRALRWGTPAGRGIESGGRRRSGPRWVGAVLNVASDAGEGKPTTIRRLVGVYNADGTVTGELVYFFGARFGRAHCALCDITHGLVRERPEWRACRAQLRAPFETFHLNDQPATVRAAYDGTAPAVLAETDDGFIVLLGPRDLSAIQGSVVRLAEAIDVAVDARALSWPGWAKPSGSLPVGGSRT
jgi:hypothetical protein